MKTKDVELNAVYAARVSGKIARVRIDYPAQTRRGWYATNLDTNRPVFIRSAARLRWMIERPGESE
jgi:hypothetical protein